MADPLNLNIDAPSKSLKELRAILGPPDPELLAILRTPEAAAEFQAQGRMIASSRVIVDAERIFGLTFATWQMASEAQKAVLIGFSEGLLAVGVDQALKLRELTATADSDGHSDETARDLSEKAVATACKKTIVRRDHGVVVLKTIAGHNGTLLGRINAAVGTADTPENLATGSERVAALGLEIVASTDPALAVLVKHTRVTAAYFGLLQTAADELRSAIESARARLTTKKVSQGEIDVLDGLVLHVLSDIIHVFAAAQDLDGTIPTLAPIATRRLLASRNKRKPKTEVETTLDPM